MKEVISNGKIFRNSCTGKSISTSEIISNEVHFERTNPKSFRIDHFEPLEMYFYKATSNCRNQISNQ
jgi:hypothetical protein